MAVGGGLAEAAPAVRAAYLDRPPQDEVIYFVLPDRFANGDTANDRGGLAGDRLKTGFDPTDKGFYHGGDLAGLTARLDYIQGLGATTIWLGPIFWNKVVQGPPGQESAGYHGYWITDFTDVDPHFGTRAQLKTLVDAAHARGLKVYLDIVANHTADVIQYRDCPVAGCDYRSKADYPFVRQGGVAGAAINDGFLGDQAERRTAENFARLTRPDFAYRPYVPKDEASVKKPAWLNDPIWYHNRGNSRFTGESSTYGDFSGLDDLATENPRVVQGFIDIYGQWIDDFGIDGYRIDTARHVNPEFWRAFVPAMLARAKARGIPNFHIFGEVAETEPGMLARFTRVDGYPAVLDFAFQGAVADVVNGKAGTDVLAHLFAQDALYEGGEAATLQLPTFLGNHDMGRIGHFVRLARPEASDEEITRRVLLAHALLMFTRGVPVLYYGDEQGLVGEGGDKDARQDMFATTVAAYAADRRVDGGSAAGDHFATDGALYPAISAMARLRTAEPALRRGRQVVRAAGDKPGLFAVSRMAEAREVLVAFNTGLTPITAQVEVDATSKAWRSAHGSCAAAATAPGSYRVEIGPLDYTICVSETGQ
ncbi:alpha-amylase family glycosyl hydrolase [Caulobacter sp. BE254]|uniref:alpha-amylase family glycosyl hydrolase n=1 Tax=Caulobacter sp. BE254 TaxID=2817720 RepID=UPI002857F626|nr:alpha-amylase family glycosyl hydrolase [Caulobacter sp. BE254]MDR7115900.1 glycosidase [Caulobacter sp. BE254]